MVGTTDPDPTPLPPLGPKVERVKAPAPVPRRRMDDDLPPGFERTPDGRLRTNIPPKE